MASKALSQLPVASPLSGTEITPIVQNGTTVQTTVQALLNLVINAAPGTLDTLKELADAMGDDANFAATVTAALAGKLSNMDPCVTNARTPLAHKSTHATGGTDALVPLDIGAAPATGSTAYAAAPGLQSNSSATTATAWTALNTLYAQTVALTANATGTLPPAASYKAGTAIQFVDGFTTGAFGIAWAPQGGDTQDIGAGTTSTGFTPFTAQGSNVWVSNGSNKWTVVWLPVSRVVGAASLAGTQTFTGTNTFAAQVTAPGVTSAGSANLVLAVTSTSAKAVVNNLYIGIRAAASSIVQLGTSDSPATITLRGGKMFVPIIGFGPDDNSPNPFIGPSSTTALEVNNGTTGTYRDLTLRSLIASSPSKLSSYTISTLPSASSYSTYQSTVTNPASGKSNVVYSNGTNWLYTDGSTAA